VLLAVLGVAAIKEFALPIIFGLLAGVYTATFIAPSLWGLFQIEKMNNFKNWKRILSFSFLKKAKTAKARS
jgi:preprotein translocase subunit SecF